MNHWIILPILIPALTAPILLMGARNDRVLARVFSMTSSIALLGVAIGLLALASDGAVHTYALGDWAAPYGIVLVLDRLSALLLLLTAALALVVLLFALGGGDEQGKHFHALYQFQLMGINGAFLTGDFFNLFVFFEILLIASYGLMVHGGGAARLKAGVQYVVINLAGSTLFLLAVGMIYAATGTLNMADLAVKVPQIAATDQALLQSGALLLLLVFCIKAALVPVHFWLPGTYAKAPAAVAALFAIMTKVGAYAIIRLYTLAFGAEAGAAAGLADPWLLPAALVTILIGVVGVLAAHRLRQMAGFAVVASMGTLLTAIALFQPAALSAALYYLLHSTLAGAVLFLIADLVARRRPGHGDALSQAPSFHQMGLLAGAFFVAAIVATGMPPFSGFLGKLLILNAAWHSPAMAWIWGFILGGSLLSIVAFGRAGSTLFWKSLEIDAQRAPGEPRQRPSGPAEPLGHIAVGLLLTGSVALTLFAGPASRYLEATAAQVFDTQGYIQAVLTPEVRDGNR